MLFHATFISGQAQVFCDSTFACKQAVKMAAILPLLLELSLHLGVLFLAS